MDEGQRNYPEEIRHAWYLGSVELGLKYGDGWQRVKELAEIEKQMRMESSRELDDRREAWPIQKLLNNHPYAAAQLGLTALRRISSQETPPDNKWYESRPATVRRRQIVLNNPHFSAQSLCKLFDYERIALPDNWEKKFNVTTWMEAHKDKKVRSLIQKMVSTDKKKK